MQQIHSHHVTSLYVNRTRLSVAYTVAETQEKHHALCAENPDNLQVKLNCNEI